MPITKQPIQRVEKPWGYELIWAKTGDYVGKILHINKGHKLSLQYHKVKEETIFVQSGIMDSSSKTIRARWTKCCLIPGDAYHIAAWPQAPHDRGGRLRRFRSVDASSGRRGRLEDGYGRTGTSKA